MKETLGVLAFVVIILSIMLFPFVDDSDVGVDSRGNFRLLQSEQQTIEIAILSRGFLIGNPHYVPENVTAKVGALIVWMNGDAVHHTVTSDAGIQGKLEGGIFDSGPIPPREEFLLDTSRLLDDVYSYHCAIHPWAKGMLTLVTDPISITTDRSTYTMGEKVTVSGIASIPVPTSAPNGIPEKLVNATAMKSVSLSVFNPEDELFLSKEVFTLGGGKYSYTFTVGIPGVYRVEAMIDNFSASTTFLVQTQREKMMMSQVKFEDARGVPISTAKVGQNVLIRTSIKSMMQTSQDYAYIVQVKDAEHVTVFLEAKNGSVTPLGLSTPAITWVPEAEGAYNVEVYLWSGMDTPEPLSTDVGKAIIMVGT